MTRRNPRGSKEIWGTNGHGVGQSERAMCLGMLAGLFGIANPVSIERLIEVP